MQADAGRIEARLGTFDTAMVVVSLVVGIGIFRTPAIVAREAGTPGLFYAASAIGGLVSLAGALVFAEIGSSHPRAGGTYRVVADCYSPVLAFMLNWAQTIMQGAGAAGVAFIGAEYLVGLLLTPGQRSDRAVFFCALTLMAVLLVLNGLGIRVGARTQNVLSMTKIVMIAGLAAVALALAPKAAGAPAAMGALTRAPALALAAALIPVAAQVAFTEPRLALAGTAILLTGWPLFLVGRRLSRAPAAGP